MIPPDRDPDVSSVNMDKVAEGLTVCKFSSGIGVYHVKDGASLLNR